MTYPAVPMSAGPAERERIGREYAEKVRQEKLDKLKALWDTQDDDPKADDPKATNPERQAAAFAETRAGFWAGSRWEGPF
jgi:hypothetical protein